MWTSTSMAVPESVLLSVMGLLVVMATLIALALVVTGFSKLMEKRSGASGKSVSRPAPEPPGISDEICSMLLAVICEELHAAPEEINVTSIRELK